MLSPWGRELEGDPTKREQPWPATGTLRSGARRLLCCVTLAESLGLSEPWQAGQQNQNLKPDEPGRLPGSECHCLGPQNSALLKPSPGLPPLPGGAEGRETCPCSPRGSQKPREERVIVKRRSGEG